MYRQQHYPLLIGVALLAGLLLVAYLVWPHKAPWVPHGTLVVAVRAVPAPPSEITSFAIGIDDVLAEGVTEKDVRATMRTRRVHLDPSDPATLFRVLSVSLPTGLYQGISFTLGSPELRNDWQQDTPPLSVSLAHEAVHLPVAFSVSEGETTVVILGMETMQAIHEKDGSSLYLPVLQVETRTRPTITNPTEDTVTIVGGTIEQSATYGMDWDGTMRRNFRARSEQEPSVSTPPQTEPALTEPLPEEPIAETEPPEDTATSTATSTEDTEEAER